MTLGTEELAAESDATLSFVMVWIPGGVEEEGKVKPVEDTQRLAVVVADTQDAAVRAFGQATGDLRVITYDDFDAEVNIGQLGALALVAGSHTAEVLSATLESAPAGLDEIRISLGAAAANAAVTRVLAQHDGWTVIDLASTADGDPLLVLGRRDEEQVVQLSLGRLPLRRTEKLGWPGAGAAAASTQPAGTLGERSSTQTARPASPPAPAPARSRLMRKLAAVVVAAGIVVLAALVVAGLLFGTDGVLVVLVAAVLGVQAATVLGVAYVVRQLRRPDRGGDRDAERLRKLVTKRTERVLQAVRTSRQQQREIGRHVRALRAVVDRQGDAQHASQNFLAEFVAQQKQTQKAAAEADRLREQNRHLATQRQVQALLQLDRAVELPAGAPPMGGWAASPDLLVLLVALLRERRPACVVETGSGISTLYLALAAEKYGIDCRIVSLEHNETFGNGTRELLRRHGVEHRAEVRMAPLRPTSLTGHPTEWYDEEALADLADIGLLLVDGPPEATGPDARFPAVPLLRDRLAQRCVVIMDDHIRASDRHAAELWREDGLADFEYIVRTDLEKHAGVFIRD